MFNLRQFFKLKYIEDKKKVNELQLKIYNPISTYILK